MFKIYCGAMLRPRAVKETCRSITFFRGCCWKGHTDTNLTLTLYCATTTRGEVRIYIFAIRIFQSLEKTWIFPWNPLVRSCTVFQRKIKFYVPSKDKVERFRSQIKSLKRWSNYEFMMLVDLPNRNDLTILAMKMSGARVSRTDKGHESLYFNASFPSVPGQKEF